MEVYVKKIVKILLIIAIVLCFLSILLPWGEISYSEPVGNIITFYSWGMNAHPASVQGNLTPWLIYLSILDSNSINYFPETQILVLPILFASIFIIFVIASILLGISSYFNVDKNVKSNSFLDGIFAIASVISFYIFIQFGILTYSGMLTIMFSYSLGYYLMIISGIIFFIAYGLSVEFIPIKSKKSQQREDNAFDILNKRYAKGEINEEEYEKIKKDIEG